MEIYRDLNMLDRAELIFLSLGMKMSASGINLLIVHLCARFKKDKAVWHRQNHKRRK